MPAASEGSHIANEGRCRAWLAYRLKAAAPLAAALGSAVHEATTTCVRALVAGQPLPSLDALRAQALQDLSERWHNSRRRLVDLWERPKAAPVFLEALYGERPDAAARTRAREKLERVLTHLVACSELWYGVRGAAPGDVRLVDPFHRFVLPDAVLPEGVPVYAAPDLLVRDTVSGAWRIVDFKSGRSDGVVDQVLTYALAAERGRGLDVRSPAARGVVVALDAWPDDRLTVFSVTLEDLVAAPRRATGRGSRPRGCSCGIRWATCRESSTRCRDRGTRARATGARTVRSAIPREGRWCSAGDRSGGPAAFPGGVPQIAHALRRSACVTQVGLHSPPS